MGFFKNFFLAILRPTPRPLDPSDSPEDQLKDAAIDMSTQLANTALRIYIQSSVERIPHKEKQIAVVTDIIEYLEGYRAVLEQERLAFDEAVSTLSE